MMFFISFWCFVVLILLNVLIALILEVYSSVDDEVSEKDRRTKLVVQLSKIVQEMDNKTLDDKNLADVR